MVSKGYITISNSRYKSSFPNRVINIITLIL